VSHTRRARLRHEAFCMMVVSAGLLALAELTVLSASALASLLVGAGP
jgi:hypothetical protein